MMARDGLVELDPDRAVMRCGDPRFGVDLLDGVAGLARHLAREFTAPVGILSTERWSWEVVEGGSARAFPPVDSRLKEVTSSTGLKLGRAALWRPGGHGGPTWLIMAVPSAGGGDWVALAGFESFGAAGAGEGEPLAPDDGPGHDPSVAWGPPCPDPALRAWGQQVLNRLESKYDTRVQPVDPTPSQEAENEHVVIGRLIRRMRISDSPSRFQGLATNVLRTSLGMAAVAWVPSDPREPVVTSGEVDGLRSSGYRAIIPTNPRDSAVVVNHRDDAGAIPGVERHVSVAAGSSGWLVGLNPSHGRPIGTGDVERMQYVASLIATQSSNARIYAELKELLFGIIRALTAAVDAKDPYTCGHSERVARIAVRLADELGMPPQQRSDLYLAGLLHDIGKIGVDDLVLKKPGPLTADEYRVIQSHVETGVTILKDLKKLSHILPAVRHHHESVDGSGYPDHLSGEEIPLEARILAVADSFDAMSSDRLYRKRMSPRQIDDVFHKGRGVQWDPNVVDALFSCRHDVEKIRQKGLGESLIGAVNVTLGRG